jgi:putative transposase
MARPQNHHVTGATYYVILRGNGGRPIFFDDTDRNTLEAITARAVSRHGIRVHAYAWTVKEAHLLIQIAHKPLSSIIQGIASQHARTVNRRHTRTGYLFQHPHRAVRIDPQLHLPAVIVHMHRVADSNWSSHLTYTGDNRKPWVTTTLLWKILSSDPSESRRAYLQLMQREPRQSTTSDRFFFTLTPRGPPWASGRNPRHPHRRRRRALAPRSLRAAEVGAHLTAHPRSRAHCLARVP